MVALEITCDDERKETGCVVTSLPMGCIHLGIEQLLAVLVTSLLAREQTVDDGATVKLSAKARSAPQISPAALRDHRC